MTNEYTRANPEIPTAERFKGYIIDHTDLQGDLQSTEAEIIAAGNWRVEYGADKSKFLQFMVNGNFVDGFTYGVMITEFTKHTAPGTNLATTRLANHIFSYTELGDSGTYEYCLIAAGSASGEQDNMGYTEASIPEDAIDSLLTVLEQYEAAGQLIQGELA